MKKIAAILLAVLMLWALAACKPEAKDPVNAGKPVVIGQGAVSFPFEVVTAENVLKKWTVNTDADTVGQALLDVSLIEGESSEFGLYVKTVDGERADFDLDGAFWSFTVNGEFANQGADQTEIKEGETYAFVYSKG